jgi:hypothetical protein
MGTMTKQAPATHNERRRGKRPGVAIKYLRRTTSGAASCGMGTTIKSLRGITGIGLGTTIKHLRGAAGIGLGSNIKYLRRTTSAAAGHSPSTNKKLRTISTEPPCCVV